MAKTQKPVAKSKPVTKATPAAPAKPVTQLSKILKGSTVDKKETKLAKVEAPAAPSRHKVTTPDLYELGVSNLLISVDLQRNPQSQVDSMEIEEGQKFFPYTVLSRLLVGWETVGYVSSFEMKVTAESSLPQITIRFMEKAKKEDIEKLDPAVKAQVEHCISMVRQFPFVNVESPLI